MSKLLKELYNQEYIELLSSAIKKSYPDFDKESFVLDVFCPQWQQKELKQRMRHITKTINFHIPKSYKDSIKILKDAFSLINHAYSLENIIFQDYVEVYGMDDFETSMDALQYFTINSSSEFAIRQFIIKYPHATMREMKRWAKSDNHHIRRLASEGCRPRLPWAIALEEFKKNPDEVLAIIEILKNDSNKYVQKSVANSINDISKENPHAIIKLAKHNKGKSESLDWILKHGCRTLLKDSNTEVLEIFDFVQPKDLKLKHLHIPSAVKIENDLEFSFSLSSDSSLGKLRVEFAIYFLRQNNKLNKKVFKISEGDYKQNLKEFTKKYSFKRITTRKYYEGTHQIEIIVNGVPFCKEEFFLNFSSH